MIGLLLVLMLVLFPTIGSGQTTEPHPTMLNPYVVQPDDTLWELSGEYLSNPTEWGKILGANSFLNAPGRVFERKGKTIVLIRPRENLVIPVGMGVMLTRIPFSELALAPQPEVTASQPHFSLWQGLTTPLPWWLWLLLAVLLVSLCYLLYRRFFANPIEAGDSIIHGGISPSRSRDLEDRFQRIAERHYAERNPSANLTVERPIRAGEIEDGTLSGWGTIQYRDRTETRHLHNEPGYKARFRFPDGHEEDIFFLQRCANDVTYSGTRYLGFTFRPGRTVVPAPSPTSQAGSTQVNGELRLTTVHVEGLTIMLPEGSDVRLRDGEITLFVQRPCEVVICREEMEQPTTQPHKPAQATSPA